MLQVRINPGCALRGLVGEPRLLPFAPLATSATSAVSATSALQPSGPLSHSCLSSKSSWEACCALTVWFFPVNKFIKQNQEAGQVGIAAEGLLHHGLSQGQPRAHDHEGHLRTGEFSSALKAPHKDGLDLKRP